jgi:hypothetical protein
VVRDLDPYAKRRVQAILRRCGGDKTLIEDPVGWRRRIARSGRHLVREEMRASSGLVPCCTADRANRRGIAVSPYWHDFQERLAAHWANFEQYEVDALERRSEKWRIWE